MAAATLTHPTPANDARRSPSNSPEAHPQAGGGLQLEFALKMVISDDEILDRARDILARRLRQAETVFDSPSVVRDYLMMHCAELPHEVFGVLWLDARHALIEDERMFRGTLTQTSVYPRELVKAAVLKNAAACIVYHNHPSGSGEPSLADERLTQSLKDALAMIDVRVCDHFIVAGTAKPTSFAERGLL